LTFPELTKKVAAFLAGVLIVFTVTWELDLTRKQMIKSIAHKFHNVYKIMLAYLI
jgi:hypothetical protein